MIAVLQADSPPARRPDASSRAFGLNRKRAGRSSLLAVATTEEIVYHEGVRTMTQQLAQLDELRTRASFLLAANGVIAGFLGVVATRHGVGGFGGFPIVAFIVAAMCCI